MNCPKCQSSRIIKYGHTHYGKPRCRCQECGRQFVENASRFNNTLRQRVGRLVRQTLSFSQKLSNHIGAIWSFIHDYNASLCS